MCFVGFDMLSCYSNTYVWDLLVFGFVAEVLLTLVLCSLLLECGCCRCLEVLF